MCWNVAYPRKTVLFSDEFFESPRKLFIEAARFVKENDHLTLTGVAQLVAHHPTKQKISGSILSQAYGWVAGQSLDGARVRDDQ